MSKRRSPRACRAARGFVGMSTFDRAPSPCDLDQLGSAAKASTSRGRGMPGKPGERSELLPAWRHVEQAERRASRPSACLRHVRSAELSSGNRGDADFDALAAFDLAGRREASLAAVRCQHAGRRLDHRRLPSPFGDEAWISPAEVEGHVVQGDDAWNALEHPRPKTGGLCATLCHCGSRSVVTPEQATHHATFQPRVPAVAICE